MAAGRRIKGPVALHAHSAASPHGDANRGAPRRGLADGLGQGASGEELTLHSACG